MLATETAEAQRFLIADDQTFLRPIAYMRGLPGMQASGRARHE